MPVAHETAGPDGSGHDFIPMVRRVALVIDHEALVEAHELSGGSLFDVRFTRKNRDQIRHPAPECEPYKMTLDGPARPFPKNTRVDFGASNYPRRINS